MGIALRVSTVLTVLFSAVSLFATAQEPDVLFFEGQKYLIATNPLRTFLEKNPGRLPEVQVWSSSLWRGYVATWEIKGDRLLLQDIQMYRAGSNSNKEAGLSSVIAKVFPDREEVFAEWFSGYLIVPVGKMVNYAHMGYGSTFERYTVLRIVSGSLQETRQIGLKQFLEFRDRQFKAFQKTDTYRKALKQAAEEGKRSGALSREQTEDFLRQFYSEEYLSTIFDEQRAKTTPVN